MIIGEFVNDKEPTIPDRFKSILHWGHFKITDLEKQFLRWKVEAQNLNRNSPLQPL